MALAEGEAEPPSPSTEEVETPPPSTEEVEPPPRPSTEKVVAPVLRCLVRLAVDAVLYVYLGALWVGIVAGNIVATAGRWVGGQGSAVASAGRAVSARLRCVVAALALVAFPLYLVCIVKRIMVESKEKKSGGSSVDIKSPALEHHHGSNEKWRQLTRDIDFIIIFIFFVLSWFILLAC